MNTILIVEDDPTIATAISVNLRSRGYGVLTATSGTSALRLAAHEHPDAILLDLGLPGLDGRTVIEGIRGYSEVPIIVVSARSEGRSKVESLDLGANDYVTKPFAMDELLARIRAQLRRGTASTDEALVRTQDGRVVIDLEKKRVIREGSTIKVTPTEWRLISFFAKHAGRLVEKDELLHAVWGPEYHSEINYLRVYLSQIRQKLEIDSALPQYFLTEPGLGYRFQP
ncbi:response regulator transcription factor [Haematomicrobium sanguinis]|uniref:response regulator transcription factor n=1 Tax=Haematomicrobium sanguinis TaxID=479106 RepID=UPI00047DAAE6|nr:response regulator transcription factor [Haematomicrobium sanguinis]